MMQWCVLKWHNLQHVIQFAHNFLFISFFIFITARIKYNNMGPMKNVSHFIEPHTSTKVSTAESSKVQVAPDFPVTSLTTSTPLDRWDYIFMAFDYLWGAFLCLEVAGGALTGHTLPWGPRAIKTSRNKLTEYIIFSTTSQENKQIQKEKIKRQRDN